MKIIKLIFLLFFSSYFSQNNNIFERLSVLENGGKVWYNIDGYSVTSEIFNYNFDEKGLKKVFRKHNISDKDFKTKNQNIKFNNFFVTKQQTFREVKQTNNYYFVENQNKTISVIWFIKTGKTDKETEEILTNAILENKIPRENFVPIQISSINFAGKIVELGNSCYWTFLNNVQCPYFGEINWSIHRTLEDAKQSIESQLNITKSRKMGKIVSEKIVDVEFEGITTKAKKVVFEINAITSVLAGGKALIIYYVAENVRNKNISCVMSFWNNDQINPETKLPPLLEKLMKLK